MKRTSRSIGWLVAVLTVGISARASAAHHGTAPGAAAPIAVPDPLKPWIPWVLQGDGEAARCPQLDGEDDARVCAWPARLALTLDDRGGTFSQEFEIWKAGAVTLAGNEEHWPQEVRVDGKPAAVIGDARPSLALAPGHHTVAGRFLWEALPDALAVPAATGLLSLVIRGHRIDFPLRDDDGRVFLGRKEAPAESDSVDISVYRKLVDDNPLLLVTRLQLAVSGKSRELLLGQRAAGRVRGAGRRQRAAPPLRSGRPAAAAGPARELDGHADRAPGDRRWRRDPPAAERALEGGRGGLGVRGASGAASRRRAGGAGDRSCPDDAARRLEGAARLRGAGRGARSRWLSGDAATATRPAINSGSCASSGSTSTAAATPSTIGSAGGSLRAGGSPPGSAPGSGASRSTAGISSSPASDKTGSDGVEIRSGRADITADSRIEGGRLSLPATGFQHDFDSLSATLAIPPGWRLIHATGADKVTGTWIDRWSLLNLFLLLVTALAVQRLFGWRLGLLALAGIGLTITEHRRAAAIWLAVLLGEAIVRALRGGKLQAIARVYRVAAWTILVAVLLPYAVSEVRRGVHPASRAGLQAELDTFDIAMFGTARAPQEAAAQALGEAKDEDKPAAAPRSPRQPPVGPPSRQVSGFKNAVGVGGLAIAGKPAVTKASGAKAFTAASAGAVSDDSDPALAQNRYVYDPNAVVQTGPGLPTLGMGHRLARLQRARAAGPGAAPLSGAPLVEPAAVARRGWRCWRRWRCRSCAGRSASAAGGTARGRCWARARPPRWCVVLLGVGGAGARRRSRRCRRPSCSTELKKRLLEPPPCAPDCGAIGRMALEATPGELRLVLEASAAAPVAIPLPGGRQGLGADDRARRRQGRRRRWPAPDDGDLWLRSAAGNVPRRARPVRSPPATASSSRCR